MKKINKKTIWLTCSVCLVPLILGVLMYNKLPNQIPIHWNMAGEVDGYASKAIALFLLPIGMALLQMFCLFICSNDPKFNNYSAKMLNIVIWIVPTITLFVEGITYAVVLGYNVAINFVVPLFVGVLFIALGNYLPKCRQNYTLGYRLPWTLNDEENWNKTNRLAGYLLVIGGFSIIIMTFFNLAVITILIFIPIFLIIPFIYSYRLYRKKIEDN